MLRATTGDPGEIWYRNPSCVFGADPYNAFESVKAKAQWAENHGFAWFSVMDYLIQIPWIGARA
jgi:hypothetical protein